jgi:hypothetical protein
VTRWLRSSTSAAALLIGLVVPWAATSEANATATTSSVVLHWAKYAAATASHDQPPTVVSANDVANSVDAHSTLTVNVQLGFNLGDEIGFPRLALFVNHSTFAQTCVDFPAVVGGTPRVVSCPRRALAEWQYWPDILHVSERAIVGAASIGQAVSGADVAAANRATRWSLDPKPSFAAGRGGVATFVVVTNIGGSSSFQIGICVMFPKVAYGIPVQVACK